MMPVRARGWLLLRRIASGLDGRDLAAPEQTAWAGSWYFACCCKTRGEGSDMSATGPDLAFDIEQNGREWVVGRDGATVSVHPNREEAERAVDWLDHHSVVGDDQAVLCGELTPREMVVLQRLKHRGSYTEIAHELFVSTNTVKTHVRNVYAKLGVTNRTSRLARRDGPRPPRRTAREGRRTTCGLAEDLRTSPPMPHGSTWPRSRTRSAPTIGLRTRVSFGTTFARPHR